MKQWMIWPVFAGVMFFSLNVFATAPVSKATTREKQATITPEMALKQLKEGNHRFVNNRARDYNYAKEMKITTKKGQFPIAIILNCIDSRSIPDILFDQGLGNLFVSRVAGNVANEDMLGSMEFATKMAKAPLIVIMGHTHCGAVQGACAMGADVGLKNLSHLLSQIKPAVNKMKEQNKNLSCDKSGDVDTIAKQNVLNQMQYVMDNSEAIKKLLQQNQIRLLGAMHDIRTGEVQFFDKSGKRI